MVALACVYPDHVSFPGVFAGLADDLAGLVVKFDSELGCPLEALEIEASVAQVDAAGGERAEVALNASGVFEERRLQRSLWVKRLAT
jgi:hypothetical protein